jgi:peptidoglycan-associated lipoprotein
MKRHSPIIFVLLITATLFVVTGCLDIVKTDEGMEKKIESSAAEQTAQQTAEQTAQPEDGKADSGKEGAAGTIKEEKIEERSTKESSLAARVETKADAMKELTAMVEKEGRLAAVYFEFDSSTVRDDMKLALDNNIEWLKKRQDVKVELQGHADEQGTNEYNIALGERRAHTIKKYLVDSGLNGAILSTISYGEERPADLGQTEEAFAKNRRVEFVIIKKK